jgi:hypothetical protein
MARDEKTTVGNVEVVLYGGLRGAEPVELGTLRMPLTLRHAATGTIEGHLKEALEYVSEDLKQVFQEERET